MTEPLASGDPGIQRRRSTRIVQAVPITVSGTDALGRSFKERTTTVIVNCHGCKYQSKHYVPKNSMIMLEISRPDPSQPPRWVEGRVVLVQRPRTVRELFQISLEFETAGNVWGIAFPPEDWFPCPDEEAPSIPAPSELAAAQEVLFEHEAQGPVPVAPEGRAPEQPVAQPETQAAPLEKPDESKIHFVPEPAPGQETQLALARQTAKIVADAKETLSKSIRRDVRAVINEEMTMVRQQLDVQLQEAVERAVRISLERISESEGDKLIQDAAQRVTEIVEGSRKAAETIPAHLDAKINRAVEQAIGQATQQAGIAARTEATKTQLLEASRAVLERAQQSLDAMVKRLSEQAEREAELAVAQRARQIEPLVQRAAQEALNQFSSQIDQTIGPRIEEAERAAAHLADSREQAAQLERSIRVASEQAAGEILDRVRQEMAKYPAEFEQSCRATLAKMEEELEQRSTEAQHSTYEALLKAADWYQKKAQTTMQTTLEKAVEQSTGNLRDRAAEISRLVASELDHYSRTYVDHSQARIEEAAKETVERERGKLKETADIANASFADRALQMSGDALRRFEQASREALEKARSDMEYHRENSLGEFQKRLDETIAEGADQARVHLESQLVPLMESWEKNGQIQKQEWMAQLNKATEDLIGQYKNRLENVSNSWMLTAATTLGQNSQAILDTLAQSAEKRLRETFVEVLAGVGDTLKERLLNLSTDYGPEGDDPAPRKK